MVGKKRQRAIGEEKEDPKKPKQKGGMQGQEDTTAAPVMAATPAALPASSLALFSPPPPPPGKSVDAQATQTEEETPTFHAPSAGAGESAVSAAAKIIVNTNGTNVSDEIKVPEPPQMSSNAPVVAADAGADTAKSSRVKTFFLFLMYVSLMASFVFAGLWVVDYVQTTEQTQAQLERDLFEAKEEVKDKMQSLQKDLNAWMGHARQLEQQKRDSAGEAQKVQAALDAALVLVRELEEQKLGVQHELDGWMDHARGLEQQKRDTKDDFDSLRKALEDSVGLVSQMEQEKQVVLEEVAMLRGDLESWIGYAHDLEKRNRELGEDCERRLSEMGNPQEQQEVELGNQREQDL
jgi:uncharacterized coiled-coil DUF342 family protein